MDFFDYANISNYFTDGQTLWVNYLVGGLCFAIVFIFQSVGLYVIAGRAGYRHRWMAFIPFLNTYYIGVCGQKNRCFNIETKRVALFASVLEAVLFSAFVLYFVSIHMVTPHLVVVDEIRYGDVVYYIQGLPDEFAVMRPDLAWAGWCYEHLYDIVLWWVDLIYTLLLVMVLSSFFQTYAPRRYFMYTLISIIFPVQGILIFLVRNNTGLRYADYVRGEQEKRYRMYREYTRNNENPYDRNDYSRPRDDAPGSDGKQGEPFSEFGNDGTDDPFGFDNSPSDPFDDLGGHKN